jgi:transposase
MPLTTIPKKRWEIVFLATHPRGPKMNKAEIARYTKCSLDSVKFWLKRYEETGDVEEHTPSGRPSITSPKEDRLIGKLLDKDPEAPSSKLTTKLKRKGIVLSDRTVRRRLHSAGLTYGLTLSKPLLSSTHCEKRLAWAEANLDRDWSNVIFTDECSMNINIKKKRVWHKPGKKLVIRTIKHPTKVHIWGCLSSKGFGCCYVFTSNLDADLMVEIYKKALLPSATKMFGSDTSAWILQEDNDPKHTSKKAAKWREEEGITRLPWPAQSPDQNCIENAWGVLRIKVSNRKPKSLKQLRDAVKEEWGMLKKEYASNLVNSMPRRVQAVIDSGGDYTMY